MPSRSPSSAGPAWSRGPNWRPAPTWRWGEYARLREERARLKVLVAHQLYGLFPEFLRVWADLLQPGALAVLRTGLTPAAIAALSLTEFVAQARRTAPATGSGATNWPRS